MEITQQQFRPFLNSKQGFAGGGQCAPAIPLAGLPGVKAVTFPAVRTFYPAIFLFNFAHDYALFAPRDAGDLDGRK
jgi:hypothetical protein